MARTKRVDRLVADDCIRVEVMTNDKYALFAKAVNRRDSIPVKVIGTEYLPSKTYPGQPWRVVVETARGGRLLGRFPSNVTMLLEA